MADLDLDLESFVERNERLATANPRQTELERILVSLESPGGAEVWPVLEALRLLVSDAVLDHDDYSLRLAVDGLHRVRALWSAVPNEESATIENRGELRGILNLASMTLERIVPLAMLAELEPDGLLARMLTAIAEESGQSNQDLELVLGTDKTQVSRAGRRLHSAGLARKRKAGRRTSWEVTPRGLVALGTLASGGRARPRRRHGTPA
jgi:hypothetical protein